MSDSSTLFNFERPGLLVSVRDAAEANAALSAGADVIDVKEPRNGSLGAASAATIEAVVKTVGGRALVTAALGELEEVENGKERDRRGVIPAGVALYKIGLSNCGRRTDWRASWQAVMHEFSRSSAITRPVAVAYADWEAAGAPQPREVLEAAVGFRCAALLVDTWNKAGGSLFDLWSEHKVGELIAAVQAHSLPIVLAGSLSGERFSRAAALLPDLVAVRGAACEDGRDGRVSGARVAGLKREIGRAQKRTNKTR